MSAVVVSATEAWEHGGQATRVPVLSARLCRFTVSLVSRAGSPARDGSFPPAEVTPEWVL